VNIVTLSGGEENFEAVIDAPSAAITHSKVGRGWLSTTEAKNGSSADAKTAVPST